MRILIEQHHGIGDMVHMLPLLYNLRNTYKDAIIDVVVGNSASKYILQLSGIANNIYDFSKLKVRVVLLALKLRQNHYDIGILSVITNEKMGQLFLWLAGCKKLIFESSSLPIFKNKSITVQRNKALHRVERNLRLAKLAGANCFFNRPKLINTSPHININSNKVIGLVVGTSATQGVFAKALPLKIQKQIISQVMQRKNIDVMLFGSKEDMKYDFSKEVEEYPQRITNYIGKTSMDELLKLLQQCNLILGGDTGTIHFADALGLTTMTIFGPTPPEQFKPLGDNAKIYSLGLPCQYCYGTNRLVMCKDRKCLNKISSKIIVNEIWEVIDGC